MHDIAPDVVSIADACLGGLQGRAALLIGPAELRYPYIELLRHAKMKIIYQDETYGRVANLIPQVQLIISMPEPENTAILTAANIAKGCEGRRTPLLIFDLGETESVEDLAGLLPAVCLYTPEDLRTMLPKIEVKAS